ncbi:hypothetical protein EMIT019CA3_20277 [Bacillus pseudomycoides]
MITYQIKHFVFSSSISVHGMPYKDQLQEIYVPFPVVFQGNSKLIIEQALEDFYKALYVSSLPQCYRCLYRWENR